MTHKLLLPLFCTFSSFLFGQTAGGRYTYSFLTLPNSARVTGLAGTQISIQDDDINLAYVNPASLNAKTSGSLSLSHQFHFADIQQTYFAYGHHLKKWGIHSHAALHHINYGDFNYGDEIGKLDGSFSASETALILGASYSIQNKLHLGANLKNIFSSLESYNSYGLAIDLGAIYYIDSAYTSIGLVIKNLGGELISYAAENRSAPLDIQIGFTKRLKHLPFRFGVIFNQLQLWDVRYDDPNKEQVSNVFGESSQQSEFQKSTDNFFRHLTFNGEFLLGKNQNLRLRGGYNHIRRKELSVQSLRSMAGFSLGLGIKISYFKLDYGIGFHHIAGGTHHLSISTQLRDFKKM